LCLACGLAIAPAALSVRADQPGPAAAPPQLPAPVVEVPLPPQFVYGAVVAGVPAHRIAMLEAGGTLPATDPGVGEAARLLADLTARYIEDAPRIAELTLRACQEIRKTNRPASPIAMLNAALAWKPVARTRPNLPLKYAEFARSYPALGR
jgi:hypothetical protein